MQKFKDESKIQRQDLDKNLSIKLISQPWNVKFEIILCYVKNRQIITSK